MAVFDDTTKRSCWRWWSYGELDTNRDADFVGCVATSPLFGPRVAGTNHTAQQKTASGLDDMVYAAFLLAWAGGNRVPLARVEHIIMPQAKSSQHPLFR